MTDWGVRHDGTHKSATETYVAVDNAGTIEQRAASEVLEKVGGSWQTVWTLDTDTIIEDWENGITDAWSGDTSAFTATTTDPIEGAQSLQTDTSSSLVGIESTPGAQTSDLPEYFGKGETLRHKFRFENIGVDGPIHYFYWGRVDSSNQYTLYNFADDDEVRVVTFSGGSTTEEVPRTALANGFVAGDVYELEIDWRDDDTHALTLWNRTADTVEWSDSFVNADNAGNEGLRIRINNVQDGDMTFDALRLV